MFNNRDDKKLGRIQTWNWLESFGFIESDIEREGKENETKIRVNLEIWDLKLYFHYVIWKVIHTLNSK